MPYFENRYNAEQYYDIATKQLHDGNISEARNNLNLARNIAIKNNMKDFIY